MPKSHSATPPAGRKGPRSKAETRSHPVEVVLPASSEVTPVKPSEIDNYTTALRYLNERVNFEKTSPARVPPEAFKLDRMRALLEELGNPQKSVKCVHIAGSKG